MEETKLSKKLHELTNAMLINMRFVMESHNQEVINTLKGYTKAKEEKIKTLQDEMVMFKEVLAIFDIDNIQKEQEPSNEDNQLPITK